MDYLPIFMAPQTRPGELTLQATADVWEAFVRGRGSAVAGVLSRHLAGRLTGTAVVRVTLPEDQARRVLQLAGVSA